MFASEREIENKQLKKRMREREREREGGNKGKQYTDQQGPCELLLMGDLQCPNLGLHEIKKAEK